MNFIRISPGEMGAMTQLLYIEKTGQISRDKTLQYLSISCLPHASNHTKGPYIVINLVFIIKDPDNTLRGLCVGSCGSPALPMQWKDWWAPNACCSSPYSLLQSFPPLFSDTCLEFSCPSETTSNSHLCKEARVSGQLEGETDWLVCNCLLSQPSSLSRKSEGVPSLICMVIG